ncbi:dienelactone hydrolase family protein [Leptolyngbya sp. FACHB-261]|uniref:dienelactone hydrolase family protein n=1 Tax=Leptolyngbya sp. FACHB-261 TaxID=2692806 RepID=UPI001684D15A|nr:alpha/beta family hydrolase [Leptolyngbya sp. FACHB-261]MBD2100417.1 dienelactone hydrolase family protein [Leptolyngbya sp. FACHB-261]
MSSTSEQKRGEFLVQVPAGSVRLEGNLSIPANAIGVVLFAHGSGSGRYSPRNRFVAETLQAAGLATLLLDLLTTDEEAVDSRTRALRFDIRLLRDRLIDTIDWLAQNSETHDLKIGCFGASTGAAGALMAAAERPEVIQAVVSRGGRPDLANPVLERVQAPTLLLVGENDPVVIDLNQQAMAHLSCEKQLETIPKATHLFEEAGTLSEVARLAGLWFQRHLLPAKELGPHLTNLDEEGNREEL